MVATGRVCRRRSEARSSSRPPTPRESGLSSRALGQEKVRRRPPARWVWSGQPLLSESRPLFLCGSVRQGEAARQLTMEVLYQLS
jgi:hypothetical protein